MLNKIIAGTILILMSGATGMASKAHAQKIRPECKSARNKVECTCALNAGGGIRPDGRWFLVRGRSEEMHLNTAFIACMQRAGRLD
jgi:hypothetical protein